MSSILINIRISRTKIDIKIILSNKFNILMNTFQTNKLWVVIELYSPIENSFRTLDDQLSSTQHLSTSYGSPLKISHPKQFGDFNNFINPSPKIKPSGPPNQNVRLIGIFFSYEAAKSTSIISPNRVVLGPCSVNDSVPDKTLYV